uniref:ADAMTS like 1 n=1 Tax=Stegastes partitus TaxID=144197 RepID=A0A3B5AIT3_9TELE
MFGRALRWLRVWVSPFPSAVPQESWALTAIYISPHALLITPAPPAPLLLAAAWLFLISRTARSEEDRDTLWDAWGSWSECSRTCGGGASYSLRRCLSSKTCEGQNIKYRTCSNVDCPPDAGDFRAQQCSAHADVRYQGQYHEWLPLYNDPDNPCTLKCKAKGSGLVVELAPKVLDGTRCYTESLDMCISGVCQVGESVIELHRFHRESLHFVHFV